MPLKSALERDRSIGELDCGLSLIALTIAIQTPGIAFLAFATERIPVRLKSINRLSLRRVFAIVIGLIGVVGLLLAALHATEAALWAAEYWWLGALNSPGEAILYSVDSISTRGASGLMLKRHGGCWGRAGGNGRHAAVWHQHGLHLHGNASLLGAHDPPSSSSGLTAWPQAD
jgi:hypothetical protein